MIIKQTKFISLLGQRICEVLKGSWLLFRKAATVRLVGDREGQVAWLKALGLHFCFQDSKGCPYSIASGWDNARGRA